MKTQFNQTLKEISQDHFNETIKMIAENTRLITIAEVCEDKNALLKLRFQKISLMKTLEYHKVKINED